MSIGLVGKKLGMTRVFTESGISQPVTVIEVTKNRVTQVKTERRDGYNALQITVGMCRANRISKPMRGHFSQAGVSPGRTILEFKLQNAVKNKVGSELTVKLFREGQKVDVTGRSIGKGFSGTMKRYGFGGGRASHGNSKAHRLPGSIGNAQDPGRVFKGKKMAGHMGTERRVQKNLEVIKVDKNRNCLLVSGSVPGYSGSQVIVKPSVKN